jgi:protein-S-isoprenylcysteine O-methyltransferase Ste14
MMMKIVLGFTIMVKMILLKKFFQLNRWDIIGFLEWNSPIGRMKDNFSPPNLVLVFIGLQILTHFFFPIKQFIVWPLTLFGVLLVIIGQVPNFWLYSCFKKEKTTLEIRGTPNKLITWGPFRFSRNPNYLGMAITLLGVSILLGSLVSFIFPLIFIVLTDIFVIPIEEKILGKRFGGKYEEYKRKVRRWI